MKLSSFLKGQRLERKVEVCLLARDAGDAVTAECILRPLNGQEESEALRGAREFAISRGVPDPKVGNPQYDLGVMAYTLLYGALDPDSPRDAREPFFDGGIQQILENLGSEQIAFLYERHETLQDECSPSIRKLNNDQLMQVTEAIAKSDDDLPFVQLAPGLRLIWARFTARLLVNLPELKLLLGSSAADTLNESSPKLATT